MLSFAFFSPGSWVEESSCALEFSEVGRFHWSMYFFGNPVVKFLIAFNLCFDTKIPFVIHTHVRRLINSGLD